MQRKIGASGKEHHRNTDILLSPKTRLSATIEVPKSLFKIAGNLAHNKGMNHPSPPPHSADNPLEKLQGSIERVTFHSEP